MKRSILFILFTLFLAVSVVLALHIAAPKKENHKHAGFDRVFASKDILQPLDTLDLKYNSYYFAGMDSTQVYLGNSTAFKHVIQINTENPNDTVHHTIKTDNILYQAIQIKIIPPYFYILDGVIPFIYRGNTTDWVATQYMECPYFVKALPISDSSIVLMGLNNKKNTFYKLTEGEAPKVFSNLLKEQGGEGIFSTDGMLSYAKEKDHIVYLYTYRNQYLYMDADLNLLYEGKTVDTISQAKIKIGTISSENKMSVSSNTLIVNKKSQVFDKYLYVRSNLRARNETMENFEHAVVIDIYDLEKGKYYTSFYIPDYADKKASKFIITTNGILVALYGQYLLTYRLSTDHLKQPEHVLSNSITDK